MRRSLLLILLLLAGAAQAKDACPALRSRLSDADAATRVAAVACNEHMIWYRAFIDRNGRLANSTVMESENRLLGDGVSPAWRRVADYWRESGLMPRMRGFAGADACESAMAGAGYAAAGCRAFVVDHAWSAAFISWVLMKAQVPGFRPSASHIDYVRHAWITPQNSAYEYRALAHARPTAGDMLCYVRGRETLGYDGLLSIVQNRSGGLNMHCEIVVAANPDNDSTAYLIGGNVQQGVTMRLLPLNRNGELWNLPTGVISENACTPDTDSACNFNQKDWAVWLKLKSPGELASLPPPRPMTASLMPAPAAPKCCINCVVGAGVPRCPSEENP